jgi:hypothetical protein
MVAILLECRNDGMQSPAPELKNRNHLESLPAPTPPHHGSGCCNNAGNFAVIQILTGAGSLQRQPATHIYLTCRRRRNSVAFFSNAFILCV